MSVATKNPFAILDSDDSTPADSPAPAAPEAAAPAPAPARGTQKPRGGPAGRGGKYYQRGGGTPKSPRENGAEDSAEKPKRTFDGEGRGEGRGRGRGRGGRDRGDRGGERRGRGGGRGGDRLDRHSATGKTDSDKKVHQSWGGDNGNTELKVEEAATIDAAAEGATGNEWGTDAAAAAADDPWGAPVAPADDAWAIPATSGDEPPMPTPAEGDKTEGRRGRDREQEEDDNTLTLDQYLAQKAEKEASILPKLETRRANEGIDESMWKDAIPVQKGDEEMAYFAAKPKAAPKARAEKKEKIFLEIDARFERPDRGGRGGRGRNDRGDRGSRPSRGRGGGRGSSRVNGTPIVNVDDETAFPSLS